MRCSSSIFLVPIVLLASACASLVGVPSASSLEDGASPGTGAKDDGATGLDQTSPPPPFNAAGGADSPSPDASTPADTSAPVDAPVMMDATPPPPPPTGCAAGATVIPLAMLPGSVVFNTTESVCVTYIGSVNGWNASNVDGRGVTVVGSTTQMLDPIPNTNQPGLDPGPDGYIYWNFTAGTQSYASMSAF